jgi:hypothetical protein
MNGRDFPGLLVIPREFVTGEPGNRVGGGITPAVLSHHRTYGSVYGGSGYAVESVYRIQYRDQPELIPKFLR